MPEREPLDNGRTDLIVAGLLAFTVIVTTLVIGYKVWSAHEYCMEALYRGVQDRFSSCP